MEIKKDLNKYIFRAYDIRGKVPTEIDEDTAYTIGIGFGSYIKELGKSSCVIAHDNRLSSPMLYNALQMGILQTGINVISLGLCTTPMYYYACIKLKIYSGIMVTASHNPKDENGFKFAINESGNCKGEEITDFLNYILKGNFSYGKGTLTEYNIYNDYIELFRANLKFGSRRLKVVIDPANGTTSIIAKKIYELFPIDLIVINGKSDGNFPNHHPDPSIEDNLEQLKVAVRENKADVGLSFDGDGDRVGIVSNSSTYISIEKYMIIVIRDIINKVAKKEFLYDVKCSKCLSDEITRLGAKGVCYRSGNSYTKAAVKELDLPFGGEQSGHIFFRDRWLGFDSGLYAGLRLLEILSKTNLSVDELINDIEKYYNRSITIPCSDNIKFIVVDKIEEYVKEKKYNYLKIDGIKVIFDDSWILVRASNTGPNLTVFLEAKTEEKLEKLKEEFLTLIDKYNQY